MISLLANNRSSLSVRVKTLNHCYVSTVIHSNVVCGAQDTDLNPVLLLGSSEEERCVEALGYRSVVSLNSLK